jgi:hypothetical protein
LTVNAGSNQTIGLGESATISGQNTVDSDGNPITYSWELTSKPTTSNNSISNPSSASFSFTPDVVGTYEFELTASTEFEEKSASTILTVTERQSTLTVDAGIDQTIDFGEEIILDGSRTIDTDGIAIVYKWTIEDAPTGSTATIENDDSQNANLLVSMIGEYRIKLTATTEFEEKEDEVVITVVAEPMLIDFDIVEDMVWEKRTPDGLPDYIVEGNRTVTASLTILEGVRVHFRENASLRASTETGSITAEGTEEQKVVFEGTQNVKNWWGGLYFTANNPNNALLFAVINNSGSQSPISSSEPAAVGLGEGGRLRLENSEISNSNNFGLYINDLSNDLTHINNNYKGNEFPVGVNIQKFHYLDAASDYTGNVNDRVENNNGSIITQDVTENVTWEAINIPYVISGLNRISGAVTIAAGTNVLAKEASYILVRGEGILTAVGTEANKITFKGMQDLTGFWDGIFIDSPQPENELTHTVISNGGNSTFFTTSGSGAVALKDGGRLILKNSLIEKSGSFGLGVSNEFTGNVTHENNSYKNNEYPVRMPYKYWDLLDSESDYTGNDTDLIYDNQTIYSQDATRSGTWRALNVPYRLDGPNEGDLVRINSAITVEAGASFQAAPNAGVVVLPEGSFKCEGTENNRITFTGANEVPGYWKGILYESNSPNNIMSYTDVKYGGGASVRSISGSAMITTNFNSVANGSLILSNVFVGFSAEVGVRRRGSSSLTLDNVTFEGNAGGDTDGI